MAFIPLSSFTPPWLSHGRGTRATSKRPPQARLLPQASAVKSADAMEFFRHREGIWSSWRVTHHLAFRRAEDGESEIKMQVLDSDDERIVSLCRDWEVEPELAQGGCYVTWKATMAWDQEGENHEGSTVFALVPDSEDKRKGRILRDRGYAEIVPIAGTYYMDEQDDLCLDTPYEGGAVEERFSFDGLDVVNRVSTVRRFGGFSTATFATERRSGSAPPPEWDEEEQGGSLEAFVHDMLLFGPGVPTGPDGALTPPAEKQTAGPGGRGRFGGRWGTAASSQARPSANSAFGSGFSAGAGNGAAENLAKNGARADEEISSGTVDGISGEAIEAAKKVGIDLTKIPPSMRDDFVASFNEGKK